MAPRAAGLNKWCCVITFVACCACQHERKEEKLAYYDAATLNISTKGGITYHDATPFTGMIFSLNAKGDTVFIIPYVNGKEHGWSKHFHDNGQVSSLRYAENGWKEGEHKGWFENGQKQYVFHFQHDMFEGNQKEWLENGRLYSDLNFEKGIESGSQRVWYSNGKIKTNYIIKNNRRYGLLGTKNCVNTPDGVFANP